MGCVTPITMCSTTRHHYRCRPNLSLVTTCILSTACDQLMVSDSCVDVSGITDTVHVSIALSTWPTFAIQCENCCAIYIERPLSLRLPCVCVHLRTTGRTAKGVICGTVSTPVRPSDIEGPHRHFCDAAALLALRDLQVVRQLSLLGIGLVADV